MSIQNINALDRVPTEVLENGAVRYEEFDADGNSLGYKYIKRADNPVEAGTNINKVLFDLIDSNFDELKNITSKSGESLYRYIYNIGFNPYTEEENLS